MAEDEARLGLISWHKRRYSHQGQRPACVQKRDYEWTWFYTAVEPMTGEEFSLYLPNLDGACYEVFLAELAKKYPDDVIIIVCDNAPAHRKKDLVVPDNVIHLFLPPYSPQLNPAERFFMEFRRALANKLFDSVKALQAAVTNILESFREDKERLELLTNFPWWWFGVKQCYDDMNLSG